MTRPRNAFRAVLAVVLGLAILDAALLLHPEQFRRRIVAAAERLTGAHVEVAAVRVRVLERVRVPEAVLRPRGAAGAPTPGEVAVRGLMLEHSPTELLLGRYRILHVRAEEVVCSVERPIAFLEAFREAAGAPGAAIPISIDRLVLDCGAIGPIPLVRPGPEGRERVVLERVRLVPAGGPAAGEGRADRYELEATYAAGPMEALEVRGEVDLAAASLALDIDASNLDLAAARLETISPEAARWVEALRPAGPVDLSMRIGVPWRRLEEASLSGEAEAFSVTLAPRGFPRPITNVSGRVSFGRGRIGIETLRGVFGSGEVEAHGAVEFGAAPPVPGIDVALDARHIDLAELRAVPLPAPFGDALAALGLEGRGGLEVTVATEPALADEAFARIRGELRVEDGSALGGALRGLKGQAWFAGTVRRTAEPPSSAVGSLRIERAAVLGVPLRSTIARLAVSPAGVELTRAEGRLSGGTFRAAAGLGFPRSAGEAPPLRLDLAAREVDLGPAANALYDRHVPVRARATGTLTAVRDAGSPGARVRAEADLGPPFDPAPLPAWAAVEEALARAGLGPARPWSRAHARLDLAPDRSGTVFIDLRAPAAHAAARVTFDAAGAATATATVLPSPAATEGPRSSGR